MIRTALVLLAAAACSKGGGDAGAGSGSARHREHKHSESGGGFNDDLANSLGGGSGSSGSDAAPSPGPGAPADAALTPTASATDARSGSAAAPPEPPRSQVQVPAELAAIKLSLLPNWDRDLDEPGTISLAVKLPTGGTKTFAFHYGFDDAKAPADREAYKRWLGEEKLLLPRADGTLLDRQRGSAWYLEGLGADGLGAFRYQVLYGGKHLVCYGSLYKDADSNPLGDIRDQTIIQAKQICETLAL
jgi:hypothetical protein